MFTNHNFNEFFILFLTAFSCVSAIGSATLARSDVKYDVADDVDLTYE